MTCPMMTCSTSAGSMPARAIALRIASPPSVVAERELSAPPRRPNGVRAVESTTVPDLIGAKASLRGAPIPEAFDVARPLSLHGGGSALRLGADDRHVAGAALAFELDRRVADAEVVAERRLDRAQDRACVAEHAIVEDDVRGERVRPGPDRPHVEVVHAHDAADRADSCAHVRHR